MSDAKVEFETLDCDEAPPGKEQAFTFQCPKNAKRRCGSLLIHGRTDVKHDPQGENDGRPQWHWSNKDRVRPTFSPSVNCKGCWHGYIEKGRCVSCDKTDEPEPA